MRSGSTDKSAEDACFISHSHEQRCHTDEDGKFRCEAIKRAWRHCPGRAPEELSIERSEFEPSAQAREQQQWPFGHGPQAPALGGPRLPPSGPFGEAEQLFAQMDSMMRGLQQGFSVPFGERRPPNRAQPPTAPRGPVKVDEI